MKYRIFLIGATIFLAIGCQRKSAPLANNDLAISISTVCGWCTGGDSLIVTANSSAYQYYRSCDPATGVKQTAATDKTVWNELLTLLNRDTFNNIHLNLCNVCADGCDVRVTVKGKNYNHSISYGSSSNEAVASIRPFLEKLEALSAGYKKRYQPQ